MVLISEMSMEFGASVNKADIVVVGPEHGQHCMTNGVLKTG